jgi:hypothetical protein
MKKTILILAALLALAPWALAQSNNTQAGTQNNTGDNVRITSGPNVVSTTEDSATIRWKTDDLASTNVKYGTDPNNMSQTQKHSGGARDHNVVLSGLQPGTTYYFAIMTNDGDLRQQGQFTTKGTSANNNSSNNSSTASNTSNNSGSMTTSGSDTVQITMGPEIRNFNGSTATLYWQTNKVAANDVRYGTDPNNMSERAFERGGSREHTAELSNLQPGKTYYFEILRRNGTERQNGSFTLPGSVSSQASNGSFSSIPVQMSNGQVYNNSTANNGQYPPAGSSNGQVQIIANPTVQSVSDTQAIINWTTNVPASSTVRYGQSWLALNQQAQAQWGTNHSVTITGLKPNTKYFFRVESAQAENTGQQARSSFGTFQTGAPGQSAQAPR